MTKHSEPHGREFWELLIAEFEQQHGVSHRQFCDLKCVNVGTFRKWLYEPREPRNSTKPIDGAVERSKTRSTDKRFIEVELEMSPLVMVRLGHVTVEFSAMPPPAWVAELAAYGGF